MMAIDHPDVWRRRLLGILERRAVVDWTLEMARPAKRDMAELVLAEAGCYRTMSGSDRFEPGPTTLDWMLRQKRPCQS